MSHVVTIKTEVRDIEAVKLACQELGLTFKQDQKQYAWWGSSVGDYPLPAGVTKADLGKCEHAIGVPGTKWEIGLMRNKETGGLRIIFDFYGTQGAPIMKAIGQGGEKLLQLYAVHKAEIEAKKRGLLVSRKYVGKAIQVCVTGM